MNGNKEEKRLILGQPNWVPLGELIQGLADDGAMEITRIIRGQPAEVRYA